MALRWDYYSAELAIQFFQKLKNGASLDELDLQQLLATPGIQFLARHLKRYGGTILDEDFLTVVLAYSLKNAEPVEGDSMINKAFKEGLKSPEYWTEVLLRLKNMDLNEKVLTLVNTFLPFNWNGDASIHVLCGVRGTGIVLENEIGFDICDSSLRIGGEFAERELIKLIAHELHHLAIAPYVEGVINQYSDSKHLLVLDIIGSLMGEGAATYYLTNGFWNQNEEILQIWWNNLDNINEIILNVNELFQRILEGEAKKEETWYLFDEQLKGYSLGFVICQSIDKILGREKMMECMIDFSKLLPYFNQSIKKGRLTYPLMNQFLD